MRLALFLSSVCALVALTVSPAQAGADPYDDYGVRGSRGGFRVGGYTRFGTDTELFNARFELSIIGGSTAAAPLGESLWIFNGTYEELDLFFISFWSAEGTTNPSTTFTGSGIRLFFGLLTFGSLERLGGPTISYSGTFDEVVLAAPRSEPTLVTNAVLPGERNAIDPRRALSIRRG